MIGLHAVCAREKLPRVSRPTCVLSHTSSSLTFTITYTDPLADLGFFRGGDFGNPSEHSGIWLEEGHKTT